MIDPVFQPIRINTLEVPNRIVMPAMHLGMAVDFQVTDQITEFYALRAKGGAGLICVGFATVDDLAGNTQNIGAHSDAFIPGLARLAKAIGDNGAKSAVQLNHAGRYNFSFFLGGRQPVAPSAIASRMTGETPRELTVAEIHQIVESFAAAASRCRQAGFDAVEILCGTGYLISEFFSPVTNQRTDAYGGSLDNRLRFAMEILEAVRGRVGKDYPLLIRLNGNDFMPGGQGRSELKQVAAALARQGVDAICVNVGWHEARVPQIVASVPRGVFAYLAGGIRQATGLPVIASHRINDPDLARQLIADSLCDMVAMGRSLIADPFLPQKAREGKSGQIVHCIACAQGCFDHLFQLKHVECLCNPLAGHEAEGRPAMAQPAKDVMVVGGGPAGMAAALAAHGRGHKVSLYERSDRLGGQLFLAAAPPGRTEFIQLAKDLARQVALQHIPVFYNTEVDEALLAAKAPQAVILATGARPMVLPIAGIDLPHVVQAWDVLEDRVATGRSVVVIGGGAVGVETALFLAAKGTLSAEAVKFLLVNRAEDPETLIELCLKGTKNIVLVEMIDKVGKDIGRSTRWGMLQELGRHGVKILTGAKAMAITGAGVRIAQGDTPTELKADTVVMAAGSTPFKPLAPVLERMGIAFVTVGDADTVGNAFGAIHQGHAAGFTV